MKKSRRELIEWIRSLGIGITRIEELGKGAIICEVLSVMHRDFPSNFIRNPSDEHEYLRNMKICQDFFSSKNIKLYFPVERLIKCRMQDNLEVAQWLARHYHRSGVVGVSKEVSEECVDGKTCPVPGTSTIANSGGCDVETREIEDQGMEVGGKVSRMERQIEQMVENERRLLEQISTLKNELGVFHGRDVKAMLMAFEKERDFYFNKLLMVERYLLENTGLEGDVRRDILEILYEGNG